MEDNEFGLAARRICGILIGGTVGAVVGAAIESLRHGPVVRGALEGGAAGAVTGALAVTRHVRGMDEPICFFAGVGAAAGPLVLMNGIDKGGIVAMAATAASLITVRALKLMRPLPYGYGRLSKEEWEAAKTPHPS